MSGEKSINLILIRYYLPGLKEFLTYYKTRGFHIEHRLKL